MHRYAGNLRKRARTVPFKRMPDFESLFEWVEKRKGNIWGNGKTDIRFSFKHGLRDSSFDRYHNILCIICTAVVPVVK